MKTLLLFLLIILFSCKKDEPVSPSNPDKLNATVVVSGASYQINATGNNTGFSRSVVGADDMIYVQGSLGDRIVQVRLTNVNMKGTYTFGDPGGNRSAMLTYTTGDVFQGTAVYYLSKANELTGSLIIDSISANFIKGTFSDTCWNGTQTAVVTGGSFSGTF